MVVGRRSARLSMIIPITIHGVDANGQTYKENTWTIGVNKQGAKIATFRPLALGAQMSIVNPVLGRTAKARVIWVGEKRFPEDPYEVGVELTEAQNVWGIKFPPEDWQRSAPVGAGARGLERLPETTPTGPTPKPAAPESPAPPEAPKAGVEPPPTTPEPGAHPEKFNQFNLAMTALSRFAQQAQGTAETQTEPSKGEPAKPTLPIDSQTRAGIERVANRLEELEEDLEELAEKGDLVRSLEQELKALSDRLEASRGEVKALVAKVEELHQGWPAEVEKARRNIEESSGQALHSAIEGLDEKLRKEVEAASSKLLEETRKRIEDKASTSLEWFGKEAGARLDQVAGEYLSRVAPYVQAQQTRATEQAAEQLGRAAQNAEAESKEKLRKMAEDLELSLRTDVQKSLEKSAGQLHDQLSRTLEDRLRASSQSAERSFQEKLQKVEEKIQQEISAARMKVSQSFEQEAEGARRTIASRVNWAEDSMNLATEAAISKLHGAYQKIESNFKAEVETLPKKLAELSTAALQEFHHQTSAQLDDLQVALQKNLSELQGTGAQQFAEQLHQTASQLLESSTQALHRQAGDVLEKLTEQVKDSGTRLVDETKRQLVTMSEATLEFLTKEARAIAEENRSLAQRSLQEFEDRGRRELEAQLQQTWERRRESLRKELEKEADDSTARAVAHIKSKSEEVVKEACEKVYKQVGAGGVVLRDWADQATTSLDASFQKSLEVFQKQISDLSKSSLEENRKESTVVLHDLHTRLQQAVRIFQSKGTDSAATTAQENPAKPAEPPPSQLSKKTEGSSDPVMDRIKENHEKAVNDATEAFRKRLAEILAGFQTRAKGPTEHER